MKFAEHLAAHITPEWRKQYITYEELKALLYSAVERAPSAELIEPEVLTRHFAKFDENFFHYCDKELAKINTFYSEKLAEATRKYANLKSELSEALEDDYKGKEENKRFGRRIMRRNLPARKIQELKLAFSEFYLSLILLQNYQNLNFTGFRKIFKKHDKVASNTTTNAEVISSCLMLQLLSSEMGTRYHRNHVENSHFYLNKDINRIILETEATVTNELEGGDRQRAMKRLRVPPLNDQQSPWITFKVGLFSGSFIVLLCTVVLSGALCGNRANAELIDFIAVIYHHQTDDWRLISRLYRGPFLIVEFLFLWGINIYGWRSSGVNHVLIFEMDPRNHLSEQHIIELAAIFGVIWSTSVLCFIYSAELHIPAYANPFVLNIAMLAFLLNPTKTLRYEARFWALRGKVLMTPFFYVTFAEFWMADQLNSLVTIFTDIPFFICFYISNKDWNTITVPEVDYCSNNFLVLRGLMTALPAWFRFGQCLRRYRDTKEAFPHLANAAKYSTTFFVIIFSVLFTYFNNLGYYESMFANPFFYLWLISSLISSCYAYTWDIKLDWGLFDPKAGDNRFLREEIVYSSTLLYYFGIFEDFILRFAWAFSTSLIEMGYIHAEVMVTILAPFEVFRRFIWNFFRLENEHLNNCGKFRAVRDISIAPIDSSDQLVIIRMMDDPDGVCNRRKNKMRIKKKGQSKIEFQGLSTDDVDKNL